jgi:hypothetical protein
MISFKIFVIPFLLLLNENCFSQVKIEWGKKLGKKEYDYMSNSIIQTKDKGYILTGGKSKSLSSNELFVAKLNSNGDLVWEKTYGIYSNVRGNSIVQLKDGGYAITGFKRETLDYMWLIKTDSLGNMLWDLTFQYLTGGWNEGMVVKSDSNNDIFVSGVLTSIKYNSQNFYMAKINSTGKLIWDTFTEKKEFELVGDFTFDENGTIYAIGNQSMNKIFLKIINENGQIKNDYIYSISKKDLGRKVLYTSDKSLLILSSAKSRTEDFSLLKVDLNGKIIWKQIIGTDKKDEPFGLIELTKGNYLLTGWTNSKGKGDADGWLVGTDKNGNKLWDFYLGGKKKDVIFSTEKTMDDGLIISGFTKSKSTGGTDAWFVKIHTLEQ